MRRINQPALSYWKYTGYTRADLVAVGRELDDKMLFLIADISPDRPLHVTVSKKVFRTKSGHAPTIIRVLKELDPVFKARKITGAVFVWLEDGVWEFNLPFSSRIPMLAFGASELNYRTLLMPDPGYLESFGYKDELKKIGYFEEDYPWDKKKPTVFWRGAGSGLGTNGTNWRSAPRMRLALLSKEVNDPDRLDAYITKIVTEPNDTHTLEVQRAGILKDAVPFYDLLKYRYQIDVDGMCCAWLSCFLKLASQCAVLKISSEYRQWYYDRLIPWTHYLPVRPDLLDLPDLIEWVRHHDQDCKTIATQSAALMATIHYEHTVSALGELIIDLLSCQRR